MTAADKKKIIVNLPYLIFFWIFDKLSYAVRLSEENILISVVKGVSELTKAPLLSFHFTDISVGIVGALAVKGILYLRSKNAKKFRKGIEYGSARWGTPEDMKGIGIFLASAASDYINGAIIPCDGGYLVK